MGTMKQLTTKAAGMVMAVVALGVVAMPARAQEGARDLPTTVAVDNARAVPLVVYLERGAYDQRIGTVPAHTRRSLPLPIELLDGEKISITVHPEEGQDLTTPEPLTVHRGQALDVYVPTNDVGWVPAKEETIPNPGIEGPTLTVENPSSHAVVVFLDRGEFDTRLTTVGAHETKTIPVPRSVTGDSQQIAVFAHIEGGMDLGSTDFDLEPSAHLLLKIPG